MGQVLLDGQDIRSLTQRVSVCLGLREVCSLAFSFLDATQSKIDLLFSLFSDWSSLIPPLLTAPSSP
jgi:hypothetical protein